MTSVRKTICLAWVIVCVVMVWAAAKPAAAQTDVSPSPVIEESEYWVRLQTTQELLDEKNAGSTTASADIRALWDNVEGVRIGDDVITVNMEWVTAALDHESDLVELRRHVRALIDTRYETAPSDRSPSLDALRDILADPRFDYGRQTPTPVPDPSLPAPQMSPAVDGLAQIVGYIALILVAVAVIGYFARMMGVQPNRIESSVGSDEPTTSLEAHALAEAYEADRDYRSAIRYLFLALLLQLDERGLIHYDPALTNREHLRQVSTHPQAADLLRQIVSTFEDVWYGFARIDEAGYQQFARQIAQLNASMPTMMTRS